MKFNQQPYNHKTLLTCCKAGLSWRNRTGAFSLSVRHQWGGEAHQAVVDTAMTHTAQSEICPLQAKRWCVCVCVPLALCVQLLQGGRDLLQQVQLLLAAVLPAGLDHSEQNQLDVVLPGFVLQQVVSHAAVIRHVFTVC